MKIKHTFKGSKGIGGYGYFAFIDGDTNELVIGENWPHEGGETFRGTYAAATSALAKLESKDDPALARAINKYYQEHLYETNNVTLACLRFGDKFEHDNQKYQVIDLNISSCFISTCGKESTIICALDLTSYKVYCFDKNLQVRPVVE